MKIIDPNALTYVKGYKIIERHNVAELIWSVENSLKKQKVSELFQKTQNHRNK